MVPPGLQVDVSSTSHRKVKGIAVTDGARSLMEGALQIGTSDTLPHMSKVHYTLMIGNMWIHDMAIFTTFRFQHIRRITRLKSMSTSFARPHLIRYTRRGGPAVVTSMFHRDRNLPINCELRSWLVSRMPWKSRKRRKLSLRLGFPASSTLLQWDVYFKGKWLVHFADGTL